MHVSNMTSMKEYHYQRYSLQAQAATHTQ